MNFSNGLPDLVEPGNVVAQITAVFGLGKKVGDQRMADIILGTVLDDLRMGDI